jgi:PKD repeat protein/glucose/arabinose dehydrogenase
MRALLVAGVLLFAIPRIAHPVSLPPGFVDEVVVSGLTFPVDLEFDPAGRLFVIETRGMGWIVQGDSVLATPVFDLVDEVHQVGDKGMLGLALDPQFSTNGRIYLSYTVDPIFGQPDEPGNSASIGRLTRYSVSGSQVVPSSRFVLIGNNASDGASQCSSNHATAGLAFGIDGSLFWGVGDGAHFDFVDAGQNVYPGDETCEQTFGPAQDLGSLRSLTSASLSGKILRVNPETGFGYPDNPHWNGNPNSFDSKIWARGLRNPFRLFVRPNTPLPGTLYIGDVGLKSWEELNVSYGGENFGWPCWEGEFPHDAFQEDPLTEPTCSALPDNEVTLPNFAYHQMNPGELGFTGQAIISNLIYDHASIPVPWGGRHLIMDYVEGWIRALEIDESDQVHSVVDFAEGMSFPTDLELDPATGDLYWVSIAEGTIHRIRWIAGDVPPVAVASANPTSGGAPLLVQFSSDGTFEPNGDPFTLLWNFGDGSPTSSLPNPQHTFTDLGTWNVRLVVTDDSGNADSAFVEISTLNLLPVVEISNPQNGSTFVEGTQISLLANASDPEDGTNLQWSWVADLIHNEHPHLATWTSADPAPLFPAADHGNTGDRFSYRLHVSVTDSDGGSAADTVWIVPDDQGPNQPPYAVLAASPDEGVAPFPVFFEAFDSIDPDGDYLEYVWDFGDGTGSSSPSTTHLYGSAGLYTVTLTARDPALASHQVTATIRVNPGNVLAHWPFDEGSGTVANDVSGNDHDGTIQNGLWGTRGTSPALSFSGTVVQTGESFLSDLDQFTFATWINPDNLGAQTHIMDIMGQEGTIGMSILEGQDLLIQSDGGGPISLDYPFPFEEWHHLAATGDGGRYVIYLDGAPAESLIAVTDGYGTSSSLVNIGASVTTQGHGFFIGSLDDVRMYSRALSASEVAQIAAIPPANAAPIALAGADHEVPATLPFFLIAAAQDDGLPSPPAQVTTMWTQESGPATATILDANAPFTQCTCPIPGEYVLKLTAHDGQLSGEDTVVLTAIDATQTPFSFFGESGLRFVAPNPSRGASSIVFGVPRDGARIRVDLYSVSGQRVAVLAQGRYTAGLHVANWSGKDASGAAAAAGIYFVVVDVDDVRTTRKLTLLR